MTQQNTQQRKALCLTTNDSYRTSILTICQTCYIKAKTRQEFTNLMETITELTTKVSDYPNADNTFMHGATLALLITGRWEQ